MIDGKTNIVGLFGYPVEHSLSPQMHNAAFSYLKLNYCYLPFSVKPEDLSIAIKSIKPLGIKGINLTIPHKEKVIPLLDDIDLNSSCIGAINTIKNKDGKLIGFNTDGNGFMRSLSNLKIDIKDKNVLILGAGGACRSIAYHLSKKTKTLFIYNRNPQKARLLIKQLNTTQGIILSVGENFISDSKSISDINIIINATPLGLNTGDPLPMNVSLINHSQIIYDLIYKETDFLRQSTLKGCKTINGLEMLLWQGALAFEIWTGNAPPIEVMRRAIKSYYY